VAHFTEEKVAWLVKNKELWEDFDATNDVHYKSLVEWMQNAGLFSKKTGWHDVNLSKYIRLAKIQLRKEAKNIGNSNSKAK
jgi:hypothetical protein